MYEISAAVRITQNQDGGTLLDLVGGQIFHPNGTGVLIFERLRQHQTESQIIEEISRDFCIPTKIVQADFTEFLKSLERQGLVNCDVSESHL